MLKLKNSVDVYNYVLTKLNKENNPSFEIRDFEDLFHSATLEWVKQKYAEMEIKQKRTDDLRFITRRNVELSLSDNKTTLPERYMFMLGVRVEHSKKGRCSTKTRVTGAYKMTSDIKGRRDYYKDISLHYEIENQALIIIPPEDVEARRVYIEYIEEPTPITVDYDAPESPTNALTALLSQDYVCLEIADLCALFFIETFESPRVNTLIPIQTQLLKP